MKHPKINSFVKIGLFACMVSLPLVGGCGDKEPESNVNNDSEKSRPSERARYLPFSIRFDLKGNPVIVDEKGNEIELTPVKPPFKATEIVGVETISVVTYKGSCKQVYNIGGRLYEIQLPDAFCKTL